MSRRGGLRSLSGPTTPQPAHIACLLSTGVRNRWFDHQDANWLNTFPAGCLLAWFAVTPAFVRFRKSHLAVRTVFAAFTESAGRWKWMAAAVVAGDIPSWLPAVLGYRFIERPFPHRKAAL